MRSGRGVAIRLGALGLCLLLASGCASGPKGFTLNFMPAPAAISHGVLDPLEDNRPVAELPGGGMLYATDRAPATARGGSFYQSARGLALRVGEAKIAVGQADITWDEARRISLLKNQPSSYPLSVTAVEEFGVLHSSVGVYGPLIETEVATDPTAAGRRFAAEINTRLSRSPDKDVFIYVHGFKVNFENPVLVGSELWHFLGNQGAFIAYSWPATPHNTAYVGDVETAAGMARNLRELIAFVENHTEATRIHVVGYSAGTRLVARTLEQIALINRGRERAPRRLGRKLENVVLISSDLDRAVFAEYVADGVLGVSRHLLIYGSDRDSALRLSRRITGHDRLGTAFVDADLSPQMRDLFLKNRDRLSYIDVSQAVHVADGNGHGYFRSSPWVSSDLLMKLAYRLDPEQRGLVRNPATGILSFPPDYVNRMTEVQAASYRDRAAPAP